MMTNANDNIGKPADTDEMQERIINALLKDDAYAPRAGALTTLQALVRGAAETALTFGLNIDRALALVAEEAKALYHECREIEGYGPDEDDVDVKGDIA